MTKGVFRRSAALEWEPGGGLFGGKSLLDGRELAWVKVLSDRRGDGEGIAYLLNLRPPAGRLINLVATARSDEHVWLLEGGYCDRNGVQRNFPGDYILNPTGHRHGGFVGAEAVALVVCTGEPDEILGFDLLEPERK